MSDFQFAYQQRRRKTKDSNGLQLERVPEEGTVLQVFIPWGVGVCVALSQVLDHFGVTGQSELSLDDGRTVIVRPERRKPAPLHMGIVAGTWRDKPQEPRIKRRGGPKLADRLTRD